MSGGTLWFIIKLVENAVWPATVIFALILFRIPLTKLLSRLKAVEFSGGKISAQFEIGLSYLESAGGYDEPPAFPNARYGGLSHFYVPNWSRRFEELARISPNAAIMQVWAEIEAVLIVLAKSVNFDFTNRAPNISVLLKHLRSQQVLSTTQVRLITELRNLRNLAAHSSGDDQPSVEQVLRYRAIAGDVLGQLTKLVDKHSN